MLVLIGMDIFLFGLEKSGNSQVIVLSGKWQPGTMFTVVHCLTFSEVHWILFILLTMPYDISRKWWRFRLRIDSR